MKSLAALLALMIAVPPLEAAVCDMHPPDDGGQHVSATRHSPDPRSDHDCCDPQGSDDGRECSDLMHCTGCAATAAVLAAQAFPLQYPHPELRAAFDPGQLAASHATPPFRPPKILS